MRKFLIYITATMILFGKLAQCAFLSLSPESLKFPIQFRYVAKSRREMEWRHIVTTRRSCVLAIRLQLPSWQQDPDGEAESDLMSGEAFSLLRKTRHALTTRQKPELSMLESSSKEQFEKILEEVQSKDALTRLHALAKISVLEPGESADVLRRIIRSNEPEVQLRGRRHTVVAS